MEQRAKRLVIGYWSLVTGCWLLVAGYWLLVTGYWLLVAGCGPDAVGQDFASPNPDAAVGTSLRTETAVCKVLCRRSGTLENRLSFVSTILSPRRGWEFGVWSLRVKVCPDESVQTGLPE